MTTKYHLGTMGFGYKQWVGSFYPAGMSNKHFLRHYSQFFDAVEIDSTFYGTPRVAQVERWGQMTPPDFRFCLKTPRQITHDAPLTHGITAMQQFVTVASVLGDKLGPILIQFGPEFTAVYHDDLARFLAELPTNYRYAVEFRNTSWISPETASLLVQHQVAWVAADYIHLPHEIVRTTDFLYMRFIGPHGRFATKDKELIDQTPALAQWHAQIKAQEPPFTAVYGFFNNDYSGHSPATCNRFRRMVGLEEREIRPLQQGRLF